MTVSQTTSASYEVGYRKPPRSTQFQKGQSGNPGGRPRRSLARRLEDLALYEAYRTTIVMEDGHAVPMPAIQAVLRRQIESAASGSVRAQRDILAIIQHIELVRDVLENDSADDVVVDDDDADANDGDNNEVDDDDSDDDDVDDGVGRDDAGGADDDEAMRQRAEGIDKHGQRRQGEREGTPPPPAVSAPQPEDAADAFPPPLAGEGRVGARAASSCRGKDPTPALPEDGEGEETRALATGYEAIVDAVEAVCNGSGRRAGVQTRTAAARKAPPRPRGQRRQNQGRARRKLAAFAAPDEGRPAQTTTGQLACRATPAERDEKLKIPC